MPQDALSLLDSPLTRLVAQNDRPSVEAVQNRYPNLIEGVQSDLSCDKVEVLREQKDFYLRHGFISKRFDNVAWVTYRPLEAVIHSR